MSLIGTYRNTFAAIAVVCLLGIKAGSRPAFGQELTATAAVESQDVFLGEPFLFQIKITGADSIDKPDFSALTDFVVREQNLNQTGSSSFSISINGRQVQSNSEKSVLLNTRIVPRKVGILTIPSIEISANGKKARTAPIQIRVNRPAETEDFKLRLSLSNTKCYVGEPVILRAVWYVGTKVGNYELSVPILGNANFTFADPQGAQYSQVQVAGGNVAAVQSPAMLDGRQYESVTFSKVLIPKKSGTFEIPAASVVCAAYAGQQKQQSPFGDDFPFFASTRDVYKKVAVSSESTVLEVLPMPTTGKPAGFAGHVGEYTIAVSATPVDVSIGDPITLTVALSGPAYLDNVELPPLGDQPALAKDFRIPKEIAPGKIAGGTKVFTQSIRAMREDVQCIPPVELVYFDTKSGQYKTARSVPIPLKVKATRVVTPGMAEGVDHVIAGSALEAWGKGIAHNYEAGALVDQRSGPAVWIRSPAWLGLLVFPPCIYFVTLAATVVIRRRRADPLSTKARRAYGEFARNCRTAARGGKCAPALLEAMRVYLGCKLKIPSVALSYRDVEALLVGKGIDQDTLSSLRQFFGQCEADSYAGGSGAVADHSSLVEKGIEVAGKIERRLR